MTIPVSVRVDAIAERFHIDCHMFCILLVQDPNAVSDSALECFGRRNNLLWPTGAALTGSFDRCRWRPPGPLPALCKSDKGFQFPATTPDFLRIPKQGIALSACQPLRLAQHLLLRFAFPSDRTARAAQNRELCGPLRTR